MTAVADDLDAALMNCIETEVLTPEAVRKLVLDTYAAMEADAGAELREKRAALEGRIANLAAAIADGSMDLADVGPMSAPLRKQRADCREELANLPEPKHIPAAIDPEEFRATIIDT